MLTKDDKKYLEELFNKKSEILVKDMLDLFNVSNSVIEKLDNKLSDKIDKVNESLGKKIDDTNERIDKIFEHLSNDFDSIEDHEKRIGKIEEKVFVALS